MSPRNPPKPDDNHHDDKDDLQKQLQAQLQGQAEIQAQGQAQGEHQSQSQYQDSSNCNVNGNLNCNANANESANCNINANYNSSTTTVCVDVKVSDQIESSPQAAAIDMNNLQINMAVSCHLSSVKRALAEETNWNCIHGGGRRGKLLVNREKDEVRKAVPGQGAFGQTERPPGWRPLQICCQTDVNRSSGALRQASARAESKARAQLRRAGSNFQRLIGNVERKRLFLGLQCDISHDTDPFGWCVFQPDQ